MLYTYHIGVKWGNLRSVKCDKHQNINKEDENQHIELQKIESPPKPSGAVSVVHIYF